jgi:membrane protein
MNRLRWLAILTSLGVTVGYGLERARSNALHGADAAERGRLAPSPWRMTWLGWKDILARTLAETFDDRLLSLAGGVAFFTLLAIVPGLSVLVSLYGLVAANAFDANQLVGLLAVLPSGAREIILEQAQRLAAKPGGDLSFNLALSLIVAAWSANAAMKGLFDGLNVIYDEAEKRSFVRLNAVSLCLTLGGIVLLMSALFVIAVMPALIRSLPLSSAIETGLVIARWPVFFAAGGLSIAILYWIGPSRRPARFVWVLPGALLAALLWGLASAVFSWYVSKLGDYTAAYGSLATVIVFMTWLWISAAVVLLGAEFNSELEHQVALDTTVGEARPMGMRGAVVADNVGPAVAGRK